MKTFDFFFKKKKVGKIDENIWTEKKILLN